MTNSGRLDVTVDSTSSFLRTNLPYVVRDAHLKVVQTGTVGGRQLELPEGLYSVEVTGPDGVQTTSVVQVQADGTSRVDVSSDTVGSAGAPSITGGKQLPPQWGLRPIRIPDFRPDHYDDLELESILGPRGFGTPRMPTLVTESGCTSRQIDYASWQFLPDTPPEAVATAAFAVGPRRIEMSLAVNPQADMADLAACRVDLVEDPDGTNRLRMSFAPGRSLCVTMDGLLRSNSATIAADLLENATDLLWGKYQDPPGAALGGLILHGMGRLDERADWASNLANSFPWLPDGQILYAALLMKDPGQKKRSEGLELLLSATTNRPMYTDGLSLGMELLRRWPDEESLSIRTDRLASLARYSAYADWDSINLSVDITAE
jgi:hypothetical protein